MRCPEPAIWGVAAAALAVAACGSCGDSPATTDGTAEGGCTYASCDRECRAAGLFYGSCAGGTCHCSGRCDDADACLDEAGDSDAAGDVGTEGDGPRDDGGAIETRPGASPGVLCRKVPSPTRDSGLPYDGADSRVAFTADTSDRPPVAQLWVYDWLSGSRDFVDDAGDEEAESTCTRGAWSPSLEGSRIAYGAFWFVAGSRDRMTGQLRLLDLTSGERQVLSEIFGSYDRGGVSIKHVTLRYPWLGWEEFGETPGVPEATYTYDAYAVNLETGQHVDLSLLNSMQFDILGTTGVASGSTIYEVDLPTGSAIQVRSRPLSNEDWAGVITPDWIAWLDQRAHPECSSTSPCGTQVWGFDRRTREETPLVTSPGMHGADLDGEGDWLAYTDQRDDPNPFREVDRRQNIYALHLPTMTEIRVEDWPGWQAQPKVYRGVGEWRVLFLDEVSYLPSVIDIWDCSLPDIPSP